MRSKTASIRKAFTLLEIIIVVIMIGIMSSIVLPRLVGTRNQEFTLIVERVADVVLMYAHRNTTSNQPAALQYNGEAKEFALLTKVEEEEEGDRFWDFDPLAKPINLPSWANEDLLTIYVDGDLTDTSQWPVTASPGEARPLIEIVIRWEDRSALISLASHAIGPKVWFDGSGVEPVMPIDLDAEGRGREEW
ncbi:MAG: prepilin-type N-terminal cleavage/methylation domain-containing protein [Phycisphaerae bacterium]|nr:prepilin-type N-terminal cleavage/methylation domain-containing protein [Phycisphaerae bacterium]MBT6282242.1 prepilin-type N-terminal cleavage/methylation domain-containing protein [Phycisphaerae bacterium]